MTSQRLRNVLNAPVLRAPILAVALGALLLLVSGFRPAESHEDQNPRRLPNQGMYGLTHQRLAPHWYGPEGITPKAPDAATPHGFRATVHTSEAGVAQWTRYSDVNTPAAPQEEAGQGKATPDSRPGAKPPGGLTWMATEQSGQVSWRVPAQPEGISIGDMHLERAHGHREFNHSRRVASDVDHTAPSSWQHIDHGLEAGQAYRYRVKLHTTAGKVYSEEITVTTQTETPVTPRALKAARDADRITLFWEATPQPQWVEVLYIQVLRTKPAEQGLRILGTPQPGYGITDYKLEDMDVQAGGTYEYQVMMAAGIGAMGGTYRSEKVTVTLAEPPIEPILLSARATHDQLRLLWQMPAQGDSVSAETVEILRNGTVIATVEWRRALRGYAYADNSVEPAADYRYQVRLTGAAGTVSSVETKVRTKAPPPAAPTPPLGMPINQRVILHRIPEQGPQPSSGEVRWPFIDAYGLRDLAADVIHVPWVYTQPYVDGEFRASRLTHEVKAVNRHGANSWWQVWCIPSESGWLTATDRSNGPAVAD